MSARGKRSLRLVHDRVLRKMAIKIIPPPTHTSNATLRASPNRLSFLSLNIPRPPALGPPAMDEEDD